MNRIPSEAENVFSQGKISGNIDHIFQKIFFASALAEHRHVSPCTAFGISSVGQIPLFNHIPTAPIVPCSPNVRPVRRELQHICGKALLGEIFLASLRHFTESVGVSSSVTASSGPGDFLSLTNCPFSGGCVRTLDVLSCASTGVEMKLPNTRAIT